MKSTFLIRTAALGTLCLSVSGCVLEPLPPPGPPVAYAAPCCAVYPEYPVYYGGPAVVYGRGYYGGHWGGGGYWRR